MMLCWLVCDFMGSIFLLLGPFRFSVDRIAPQSIEERSGYDWAEIGRLGTSPVLQFTGVQAKSMTLPGVIYPHYRDHAAGLLQLRLMEEAASIGVILPLISGGNGYYHGFWVISEISCAKSLMLRDSCPMRVEFSITLKKYGDGLEFVRRKAAAEFGKVVSLFS